MSLNETLKKSKLSTQCKYDIERLTNEYRTSVAPSIESSRRERSSSRIPRQRQPTLCKPLTPPVPHGNYATSPVFTRSLPRSISQSANTSINALNASGPQRENVRLPNIARSDEENDHLLKQSNYDHASRVHNSVKAREGSEAYRAYTEAFKSYTGRLPTSNELKIADKYTFVKDETGRDVVVDERSVSRLSNTSGKHEYYYLKRLPTDTKQYPAFRQTMAPKLV